MLLKMEPSLWRPLFLPFFKRTNLQRVMEQRFHEIECRIPCIRNSWNDFLFMIESVYRDNARVQSRCHVTLICAVPVPSPLFRVQRHFWVLNKPNNHIKLRRLLQNCSISNNRLVCKREEHSSQDKSGQTIPAQRPYGCETEFTSRTKHHMTIIISKNWCANICSILIMCKSYIGFGSTQCSLNQTRFGPATSAEVLARMIISKSYYQLSGNSGSSNTDGSKSPLA